MMKRLIYNLLLLLIVSYSHAQKGFLPQNLGSNVNSEYNEINPVLSPDGNILYFVRANHPENTYGKGNSQDIWFSEKQPDGTWGKAERFPDKINSSRYNAYLAISGDGSKILISGLFKKNGMYYAPGLSTIESKGDADWSSPQKLDIPGFKKLMGGRSFNASMSYDGNVIVVSASRQSARKKLDIYISQFNGSYWSRFKKLDFGKSALFSSEEAPCIAGENNDIIYFSSKREGGVGDYDIYVSSRLSKDDITVWSEPKLLEGNTNTPGFESYFKPDLKGEVAYYVSSSGSIGGTDIFKIKLKEDKPYVEVKGKIINKITNKPITYKKGYKITMDGKPTDSVKINYDSATYSAHLPFGKKSFLKTAIEYYQNDTMSYDATKIKEYLAIEKDLYVTPFPYVLLKGNFLVTPTGAYLPMTASPRLCLNGVVIDSATVNAAKASYEVKVMYGKKYSISFTGIGYKSIPDSLDLSEKAEYEIVTKDLYGLKEADPTPMAVVQGKVINKKTSKPFAGIKPFVIQTDKVPTPAFTANTVTGEYTLTIPVGDTYVINARADAYYPVFEPLDLKAEKNDMKVFKDLVIAPIEVGIAIRMNNIFFASGKAVLDPKSFPELDKLAKFLVDNPSISVEIAGHTDNVGNADKNIQLSRWRARSVELYLESKGANKDKVTFNGYGSTKPVADNKTPKGKALNRRVEFVIKSVD